MAADSRTGQALRQRGIRRIFLLGFMGAGKSTVGRAVATELDWGFADLDEEIEAAAGQNIAGIFASLGEAEFRRIELETLRRLCESAGPAAPERGSPDESVVIALGGGTFIQPEARQMIAASGQPSLFLNAPCPELLARCQRSAQQRPLFRDAEEFQRLYDRRLPVYQRADIHIDSTGQSVQQTALAVVSALRGHTGSMPEAGGARRSKK